MKEMAVAYDVTELRKQFPVLDQDINGNPLVFLDTAASSQKPRAVIDAIADYYSNHHANVHRGVYHLSQRATDMFEASRKRIATFLGIKHTKELIFTKGTTEAINLVASGFTHSILTQGDEVLITEMEHHSNIVPWQLACERTGAKLRVVKVLDNGELDMDDLRAKLNSNVKIFALVHISNALGTVNPVEEIIALAHDRGIPVLLDGSQATPHEEIDIEELDVDFYALSAHKMYGPTGFGCLYGKSEWLEKLPPYQGGGEMIDQVTFEKTTYNELPFKFEAGTPNIAGAVGTAAAIKFLDEIGLEQIKAHEHELLLFATEEMTGIEGLEIIGRATEKAGVISFVVEGLHPYDIGSILDQMGIAVRTGHHCTQPLMQRYGLPGTVRASFGMYNTMEEVEVMVKALKRTVKMLK
jgi:cysteine desulfurase/selenocysteine lyase